MKHKRLPYFTVIFMAGLLTLWGCPKKSEVTTSPETQKEAAKSPETKADAGTNGSKSGMNSGESGETAGRTAAGLKPVYFDYDGSFIRTDAKTAMQANAEWLKANPKVKVRIEGNADERGTKEYNQSLGQRRAVSAKKYLTAMGISSSRFSLLSYGKEKPICTEQNETCWQKNRRDDFIVVSK